MANRLPCDSHTVPWSSVSDVLLKPPLLYHVPHLVSRVPTKKTQVTVETQYLMTCHMPEALMSLCMWTSQDGCAEGEGGDRKSLTTCGLKCQPGGGPVSQPAVDPSLMSPLPK